MAGNTRGKLKEHFEGIHRNMDWSLHHIQAALALLGSKIKETAESKGEPISEKEIEIAIKTHPLYDGITALGQGLQILDDLAQQVYGKL